MCALLDVCLRANAADSRDIVGGLIDLNISVAYFI